MKTRKILSLILALCLCLGLLPMTALAASDFTIEDGVLTKYNGPGGDVVIPQGVVAIGDEAFKDCTSLTSVTIPSGVTTIGKSAFWGCPSLTSVTIPSGVTEIGGGAFEYCFGLTSVTIPSGVTEIGGGAFAVCDHLTSVTIPGSVTEIGPRAFYKCIRLTSVTILNGVTEIGSEAFRECSRLTNVTIPGSVTEIGRQAFWSCTRLTSVTIPSSVTKIGSQAFDSPTNPTIYGVVGSYAETYAKKHGFPFVDVSAPKAVRVQLNGGVGSGTLWTSGDGKLQVPTNPTKEGYTFGGWYIDEALTIPWNFDSLVSGDIVLYAKWNVISSTATTTAQSTQTVTLNGKAVQLQGYTLKADNGGEVTYVKLRDVAALLDGTPAQFNVEWRSGAIYVAAGKAYTARNGTELKAITVLDTGFRWNTAPVLFDGLTGAMEGIVITDVENGGHTFFKLRDLAQALGFNVGWSAEKGIFVETDKPYDPNN